MAAQQNAPRHRLTLGEIVKLDETLPPAVQQIESLHYEASKLVLGGDSNVGKTWAALSADLAVASGSSVWGQLPTQQAASMHFACEGMYRLILDATAKVARGLGIEKPNEIPFALHFREQIRLRDRGWRNSLIADLRAMEVVRLTIDPIAMAATFNELSPESWKKEVFDPLDAIIDETGVAVTLSHHANKMSLMEKVPAKAAMRGSTSLPAWADSILFLRDDGHGLSMEHAKMRGGPRMGEFNMTIVYEPHVVRVLCEESDSKEQRQAEIDEAILDAQSDGGALTQGELETQVRRRVGGAASATVRSRIRQLVKDKVIKDIGGGGRGKRHRYSLMNVTDG